MNTAKASMFTIFFRGFSGLLNILNISLIDKIYGHDFLAHYGGIITASSLLAIFISFGLPLNMSSILANIDEKLVYSIFPALVTCFLFSILVLGLGSIYLLSVFNIILGSNLLILFYSMVLALQACLPEYLRTRGKYISASYMSGFTVNSLFLLSISFIYIHRLDLEAQQFILIQAIIGLIAILIGFGFSGVVILKQPRLLISDTVLVLQIIKRNVGLKCLPQLSIQAFSYVLPLIPFWIALKIGQDDLAGNIFYAISLLSIFYLIPVAINAVLRPTLVDKLTLLKHGSDQIKTLIFKVNKIIILSNAALSLSCMILLNIIGPFIQIDTSYVLIFVLSLLALFQSLNQLYVQILVYLSKGFSLLPAFISGTLFTTIGMLWFVSRSYLTLLPILFLIAFSYMLVFLMSRKCCMSSLT